MSTATPEFLGRRGIEPGLVATILASAVLHAGALALLLTIPGRFLSAPTKPQSYTVDLVAPDAIGGTNLVRGGGRAKAPVAAPAPPAAEPKPAPPKPEAVEPIAAPAAAPPKAAEPARPVEPPKPAEPVKQAVPPKPIEPPPAPAAVSREAPAKAPEAKPAAPPAPVAEPKPPEAKPVVKPPEQPKAAAKPAELPKPAAPAAAPKPAPPAAANPAPAGAAPADAPAKPAPAPRPETAPKSLDDQIASAVQRRAAQVKDAPGAATSNVDKQIAAAVQRRAEQLEQGAGAGTGSGGAINVGPGSGTGGTPADLQYILYQGRMEAKIKAAWAWAGADKALQAVIQFNLTPEGEIRNVRTTQSSGDRQYDASCERAVRASTPLEPVPEKYRKEFATVEMTFKPTDLEH